MYCNVETKQLTIPGAAAMLVGEVVLFGSDDYTAVIVARDAVGFYALSAVCTHQCCVVTLCNSSSCKMPLASPSNCAAPARSMLVAGEPAFFCPCHGSEFAADGSVVAGPARLPLPSVALEVRAPDIIVDLSRPAPAGSRTPGT
jgi:Rieske Fe-S protein